VKRNTWKNNSNDSFFPKFSSIFFIHTLPHSHTSTGSCFSLDFFCILYTIYSMQEKIERFALRELVHRKLLERIVRGQLPPGSRVKDTDLSQEMHVSRTPVREALLRLVKEGFLENAVGRGFMVRPLTHREVREIYPVIWTLESLALTCSKPLTKAAQKDFDAITKKMKKPHRDFIPLIELDQQWHDILLSGCDNQRLLDMIKDLKIIAFRYEYAFMQEIELVKTSMQEHHHMVETLFNEGVQAAAPLLEKHWEFTMNAFLEKLTS